MIAGIGRLRARIGEAKEARMAAHTLAGQLRAKGIAPALMAGYLAMHKDAYAGVMRMLGELELWLTQVSDVVRDLTKFWLWMAAIREKGGEGKDEGNTVERLGEVAVQRLEEILGAGEDPITLARSVYGTIKQMMGTRLDAMERIQAACEARGVHADPHPTRGVVPVSRRLAQVAAYCKLQRRRSGRGLTRGPTRGRGRGRKRRHVRYLRPLEKATSGEALLYSLRQTGTMGGGGKKGTRLAEEIGRLKTLHGDAVGQLEALRKDLMVRFDDLLDRRLPPTYILLRR